MQTLVLLALTAAILMVAAGQTVMIFTALYGSRKKPEKPVEPDEKQKEAIRLQQLEYQKFCEGWENILNYNGESQEGGRD